VSARSERFTADEGDDGLRLDQVLARRIAGMSRRKARVLVDIGGVFVDKARVKVASRPVRRGQIIEAHLGGALERATGEVGAAARDRDAAELPPYAVVFEDDHVVVVDKPAGLVTAPTPESDRGNLLDLLARRRGVARMYLVHRIDLPTSGLLVFAKSELANKELGKRFAVHDIEREYRAVVAGVPAFAETTIDAPIRGKRAVTHVAVAERFADAALVVARLETGRTHQIRVHLTFAGHPLVGDTVYGRRRGAGRLAGFPRQALHAATLGFRHPATGEEMRFESPLPADMAELVAGLRRSNETETLNEA
jgi:23S rRNA pseudouridine1911/1915/1917 synthase